MANQSFEVQNSVLLSSSLLDLAESQTTSFIFNGLSDANLTINGCSSVAASGYLSLTTATVDCAGQVFTPVPLLFKRKPNLEFSFSTTFVFAIKPENANTPGSFGMAFVISPTSRLWPDQDTGWMLGVFNKTNNGLSSNHIVAIELKLRNDSVNVNINSNKANIYVKVPL